MSDTITIDGSQGEGGGQMLRTSLSLAAVTGRAVRLTNIRAGRSKSGLAPQHLMACQAVATVCAGDLRGAELRSQDIELRPAGLAGGEYHFDITTAGSTGLLLQALLPPLVFAAHPSHVTLHGGTDVPWSPVFYYVDEVFLPVVRELGVRARVECRRRGWYPAGGGEVQLWVEPLTAPLQALQWTERGQMTSLAAHSLIADRLPRHIAERQCQSLQETVGPTPLPLQCEQSAADSLSPGTTCFAAVRYASGAGGFTALGERGKPAEVVGQEAGEGLRAFTRSRATLDERLADQLQLYAALAQGETLYTSPRLTGHLQTNADVIKQLLQIETHFEDHHGETLVRIHGLALQPKR